MNNFQNPFEAIMSQMNQAKSAYDTTMTQLQGQLQQARQAMNFQFNPAQFQQTAQPTAQSPVQQNEIPTGVTQISILGEIKSGIEKTNDLLDKFINGTPIEKPKKANDNEGAKK